VENGKLKMEKGKWEKSYYILIVCKNSKI
jgi:hypothetical protein